MWERPDESRTSEDVQPVADASSEQGEQTAEVSPEVLVERLKAELEECRTRAEDYWDRFLRARAELDNYRKRVARDVQQMVREGKRSLIVGLLEVVDNFERALAVERHRDDPFYQGMAMVHRQLLALLEGEGVRPIQAVGNPFDPSLHEAVEVTVSEDVQQEMVAEELRKGYTYEGQLLRPARVRVARPAVPQQQEEGARCGEADRDGS